VGKSEIKGEIRRGPARHIDLSACRLQFVHRPMNATARRLEK
jgi:hypothetical protein